MAGERTLTPTAEASPPLLRVRGLSKYFDHVVALENVSFEAHGREVLGLVGDNGAGKSTLIKLVSGIHRANAGEIYFSDRRVAFGSPGRGKASPYRVRFIGIPG